MIDLSRYRVIDLSHEILPGEWKTDGRFLHGEGPYGRPVEVREFFAYNARMHLMQGQTHTGTHVEGRYKYDDQGADMADMPLELYLGEAVVCDVTGKPAGAAVEESDLKSAGVRRGDIVLIRGADQPRTQWPHVSLRAVDWLIETKIKLLGMEFVRHSPPGTPLGKEDADGRLLLAGIALADMLKGLHQIRKPRVFFIALPVRLHRVTASWTRAIALEERD